MPPRYAYWTILIDQKPTAFRAREREELLPTLHQLRRKNADVTLRWFARGQLWESPAAAQEAQRAPKPPAERRGREWRPGGEHRDPRDRFKKRSTKDAHRPHTTAKPHDDTRKPFAPRATDRRGPKPFPARSKQTSDRPPFSPRGRDGADRKPSAPRAGGHSSKPWQRDRPAPHRQGETPPYKRSEFRPLPPTTGPDDVTRKRPDRK